MRADKTPKNKAPEPDAPEPEPTREGADIAVEFYRRGYEDATFTMMRVFLSTILIYVSARMILSTIDG